jgi:hypothetical protein
MSCAVPWTDPTDHSPDTLRITCQSKHSDTSEFTIRNEDRFTLKLPVPNQPNVIKVELVTFRQGDRSKW